VIQRCAAAPGAGSQRFPWLCRTIFYKSPGILNGEAHGCGDGVDYFSNASSKCCSIGEDFNAIHAIIRRTFSLSLQLIT
jgi:hypothetical protein